MSSIIKSILFISIIAVPQAAFALDPCKPGVPAIDIVQGAFAKAPGYISPDTESLNPDGSLKQQGWHNLRKAQRPLRILCRYKDKSVETVFLAESTDTCIFVPGKATCN